MRKNRFPISKDKQFYIQKLDPLQWYRPVDTIGESDNLGYAVKRCKQLAEDDKGKDRLCFYRVLEHHGEVVFFSHVNFDEINHYDYQEKLKQAQGE